MFARDLGPDGTQVSGGQVICPRPLNWSGAARHALRSGLFPKGRMDEAMSMSAALQAEPQPIVACTISRDVQNFDLLIEDMEASLGERWGDLTFVEALGFLEQPDASEMEFVAIALDAEDEADLSLITDIIAAAKARSIKVILIAEDVSPAALHQLLREGGDEFVPYPLPEGELARAIQRVNAPPAEEPVAPQHCIL